MIEQLHQLSPALRCALLSPTPPAQAGWGYWPTIDWAAIAQEADQHAIGPLIYARLEDLGLSGALPDPIGDAWKAASVHARLQCALQHRDAIEISSRLRSLGVRHAFLKGFAYRETLYDPTWVRIGGDSDILVDSHNIELARGEMVNLGFVQASSTLDYRNFKKATWQEIHETELNHYELGQFVKVYRITDRPPGFWDKHFVRRAPYTFEQIGDDIFLNSVVDIHWALHFAFSREPVLDFVELAPASSGGSLPVLAPEWSLFNTCFKLYFEAFDRPRYGYHHLVDIIAILGGSGSSGRFRWTFFRDLVRRYSFEPAAYYTLTAAEGIAARPLAPREVIEEWSTLEGAIPEEVPSSSSKLVTDYGDFMPYVIGRRMRVGLSPETVAAGK